MSYGQTTTAAEVIDGVDLTGEVAVITGTSSGIGLETARALAVAGATVIGGNRNAAKAQAAADEVRATVPGAQIELGELDLTSLDSVRAFAAWVLERHPTVDLLINNAGVMATPFERTADGFELQFGTNHLAHFLLTNLLMPALLAAGEARVVNVSSNAHGMNGIFWDDVNWHTTEYAPWPAYAQSKTANVLFTIGLQQRYGDRGVSAFALHPGLVGSDLFRYLGDDERAWLDKRVTAGGVFTKDTAQGAATSVVAATAAELAGQGGAYLEDCTVRSESVAAHASDPADAARLWELSEELVGQSFPS
jgi:NAD(P)-dependent dehydrogenase (short-subunit alcohol dehydrogenase family)